jgi:hypothetical protein
MNGIAMGSARNESHFVSSSRQPAAEIASHSACCHHSYPHALPVAVNLTEPDALLAKSRRARQGWPQGLFEADGHL